MARPYRVRISVYNDSEQRKRDKEFHIPEGVILDNQKLAPVGLWLQAVVDAFDQDGTNDDTEELS